MTQLLQRILPTVQKPARYTGGEYNEIKKNLDEVRVRVAFCFPDTYEIGMSNVGMRILYGVMKAFGANAYLHHGETWKMRCVRIICRCGHWRARIPLRILI